MRKIFSKNLTVSILLSLITLPVVAQQMQPLPIDAKVRYGKLDNGLTYYIRHNEEPKQRAEFYIAQRVGSILEEEPQRGLAHFLEHMAFNGTKNYPGKALINYLETIGVKFGENLNAYTAFDETVYNMSNVPMTRETIIDSCLLILHDWSGFISLDDKEIDKERGVIHEEWRTRRDAQDRIWEQMFPEIYPNSQYAYRMPIGLMSVVDNFKYQALRDYYKKWYRPDLQAIIVVGDVNVDQVEAKLKKIFSDIPKPVNAAKRIMYPVPDNVKPLVSVASDKEATNTTIAVFFKHNPLPEEVKPTAIALVQNYLTGLGQMMLNNRLSELTQSANPPFVGAEVEDGEYLVSRTKDALTAYAVCKEGEIDKSMTALVKELYRVDKFGFTESELERAKANMLRSMESTYQERNKLKNGSFVREYVSHFTTGEVIPGIEYEYNFMNNVLPKLSLQQVNQSIQELLGDSNVVITVSGPQKEGLKYPTKEELLSVFEKAKTTELTPYQDKVSNEPLVPNEPKPGKVIKSTEDKKYGATVWTLSNGAKVVLKKTDFKEDQILMKAVSFGGNSLLDNKEIINILAMNDVIGINGLGNYSKVDLPKVLAGKKAGVSASIGTTTENVGGSCSPKDLATMMQLTYLTFTAPRTDSAAFISYQKRSKAMLENNEANPMVIYRDSLYHDMYGDHPRAKRMKADMIDKVDYKRIMDIYAQRFANAADFTFFFVGNVNADSLKPLVEKYIASLPAKGKKEKYADIKMTIHPGIIKHHFDRAMETPKSTVYTIYSGKCPYTLENQIKMSMLDQILDIVYTEKAREDQGGTYGVGVNGSVSNYPKEQFRLLVGFDTNEQKRDTLLDIVYKELKNIAQNGPSEVNLNKVKEFMLKKHKEDLRENNYWTGVLYNAYMDKQDFHTQYEAVINSMNVEKIKKFAAYILAQGNDVEVIMNGKKKE
ncbi:M16 family metallopeptidase [Parabacteroides sp. FAFU027]|uniref:M16 family metallopeptidase n=1 Tax=Parabacteroides sp. FAFU027 TaxID=2922715 RepID=UPI001FAFC287|nr:M16 family metallopeptidase [Parabacteroides sp. FAFU027]